MPFDGARELADPWFGGKDGSRPIDAGTARGGFSIVCEVEPATDLLTAAADGAAHTSEDADR